MATGDASVYVPTLSTGTKIDTTEIVRADGTSVERQRVVIGDDDGALAEHTALLHELICEIRDFKWRLLSALR